MRSLRSRSCIDYALFDISSGSESETDRICEVSSEWKPNAACRPLVDEAPIFYPNEEEFKDTLRYIASIQAKVQPYGICRIVPPPSFKPPCPLKERNIWEKAKFETRIQEINKLQNRKSIKKKLKSRTNRKRRRRRSRKATSCRRSSYAELGEDLDSDEDERFGFLSGPDYTLEAFQKYADNFKEQYFRAKSSTDNSSRDELNKTSELSVEAIEGEYWRLVEKSTEKVEVLYGADLETAEFGSGFPRTGSKDHLVPDEYVSSGWNLNNLSRLPGSLLSFEEANISGVLVPWLYVGMCFSSFCWHVEDHHLYSLNYMHWGEPKVWYGIPGRDALKLECTMRKHLPHLFKEQPALLNELVTQLSPSVLKSEGVAVFRTVQHAGEYVLTFPRAYHSGFNCGFNCAEAVNVAPFDWLPHGQSAVEFYQDQHRKTSISHDKLLLGAANEAVRALWEVLVLNRRNEQNSRWESACGRDGILTAAVKSRIEMELVQQKPFADLFSKRRMEKQFDVLREKECFMCYYDLHLSATGCECSPNRYSCLDHAKKLCSCNPRKRYILFRYDMNELATLVQALEGHEHAIRSWISDKLGIDSSALEPDGSVLIQEVVIQQSEPSSNVEAQQSESSNVEADKDKVVADCSMTVCGSLDFPKPDCPSKFRRVDCHDSISSIILQERCSSGSPISLEQRVASVSRHGDEFDDSELEQLRTKRRRCSTTEISLQSDDIDSEVKCKINLCSTTKTNPSSSGKRMELNSMVFEEDNGEHQPSDTGFAGDNGCHKQKHSLVNEVPQEKETSCLIPSSSGAEAGAFASISAGGSCFSRAVSPGLQNHSSSDIATIMDSAASCSSGISSMVRSECVDSSLSLPNTSNLIDITEISDHVTLLNVGALTRGKLWCCEEAIFPKGFRSRVIFYCLQDPTRVCNYISEVQDAGLLGPLFKVFMEDQPSEVICETSPRKCWEALRLRLNEVIERQSSLGKKDLPPLLQPESIDGLKMFGFCSSSVTKAIQSLDPHGEYTNYLGVSHPPSFAGWDLNDIPKELSGHPSSESDQSLEQSCFIRDTTSSVTEDRAMHQLCS